MKQICKQQAVLEIRCMISLCIVIFVLVSSLCFFSQDPSKILSAETLEQELERVKKQKDNTHKEIEQAKKAESEYIAQVNQVEGNLINSLNELGDLNTSLAETKTEIDRLTIDLVIQEKELADTENNLNEKIGVLNSRVASIYKYRGQDVVQLLFESGTFIELFSRLKLMNMIAQQDVKVINDLQETRDKNICIKENIEELKDDQKEQKDKIEQLVEESEKKKREVENIYAEKKTLLSKTRANKEALIQMEKELAAKENEITKKLEALRHGNAPGKLLYPAKGVLTSGFGYRISPISGVNMFHGGIDIGAATGIPIVAAADGEVLQAEYMGGYGYSILIYHGGGFATFYAHLSGFTVSAGSKVKRGQVIGYMGSTGYSTGPHLHFEVRVNGGQKNPYSYF